MSHEMRDLAYRRFAVNTVGTLQAMTDLDAMYELVNKAQRHIVNGPRSLRGPLDKIASRIFEAKHEERPVKSLQNRLAKTLEYVKTAPMTKDERIQKHADRVAKERGR